MARVWMHNGFLQVEGDKMSKSLGNFVTIRELLEDWPGEVIRFNMLRTHYRQPIDWTVRGLEESERVLKRWYGLKGEAPAQPQLDAGVLEALADDLNTPKAIAELHGLDAKGAHQELAGSLAALGFLSGSAESWSERRRESAGIDAASVEALIEARREARASRDFARSDELRDELRRLGVEVKDNKDGTTSWEVSR
jgi:cysteinyl-tRNA synthetase